MIKIESYLRMQCADITSSLKKDKCNVCKATNNLELHHIYEFEDMIIDAHKLAKITRYQYEENYTKENLQLLVFIVRGMHAKTNTTTVCNECHKKLYKEISMNKRLSRTYIKNNISKVLDKDKINKYLESLVNIKMDKEKQLDFVDFIKRNNGMQLRCKHNKLQLCTINNFFLQNNIKYKVTSIRTLFKFNHKYNEIHSWVVTKIDDKIPKILVQNAPKKCSWITTEIYPKKMLPKRHFDYSVKTTLWEHKFTKKIGTKLVHFKAFFQLFQTAELRKINRLALAGRTTDRALGAT